MNKYYITFGLRHNHEVEGQKFHRHTICEIESEDYHNAINKADKTFGSGGWACVYEESDIEKIKPHYDEGIVKLKGE